MKFVVHKCILFLALLLIPFLLFAHEKEEHTNDMRRIFPFVPYEQANKEIEEFYYLVNSYIDYTNFPSTKGGQVGTPLCIKGTSIN